MKAKMVCPSCGHIGAPRSITRGSFWIELFAWCLLIVPGVIYSLWRLTTRYKACPRCHNAGMIPSDSPIGRKLVEELAAIPISARRA